MKILVCVKQVPDKDSTFRIDAAGTWVETENLSFQINDYDRYALEEALRLKDAGGGEVVVCSVGPDRVSQAIKTALAMGADRAIHINDPEAEGADPLGVARMIHATIGGDGFDLVLAGLQTEDDNSAQLGPMLARLLDVPCATGVTALALADDGKTVRVERELENNRRQVVELDLPAVVSVQTGINQPRYASLKGIMAAKRKEMRVVKLADVGLAADQAGGAAARMRILSMAPPPKGEGAELVEGSADEVAAELVRRIKEKTGMI
jgi:electron transfer flavoprotein beta subunit